MTDAGGIKIAAVHWSTDAASLGAITEIDRYNADGTVVERWKYSYNASGSLYNAGLLNSVQLCRSDGQGNWPVVQQVLYGYYNGTYAGDNQYGNLGDLKTATVRTAATTSWASTITATTRPRTSPTAGSVTSAG